MMQRRITGGVTKYGPRFRQASAVRASQHLVLLYPESQPQSHPIRQVRSLSTKKSPFDTSPKTAGKKKRKFVPPKAAVELTPKARKFFKALLENPPRPDIVGVMLKYSQASSGQPRMVFSFDFVTQYQIAEDDEGVSLELLDDGTPKQPKESLEDGLPKLYVNHSGFMKVLGCTLDVDIENMKPILYDPEGNVKDPNVT